MSAGRETVVGRAASPYGEGPSSVSSSDTLIPTEIEVGSIRRFAEIWLYLSWEML